MLCYAMLCLLFYTVYFIPYCSQSHPDYMKSPEEYAVVLTPTEKKVLKLMVDGLSYEQIGEKLNKKVGTVKYHTSGIYRKLGVKNRQQAVKRAAQIEWM